MEATFAVCRKADTGSIISLMIVAYSLGCTLKPLIELVR